jgi:DNA polymerase elongation subunit (family B)
MGRGRTAVYGLDIETDTSTDGLDPSRSAVLTVALSLPGADEVYIGVEWEILVDLDARLRDLEPGVIATWNGATFDLPFIADRAALWGLNLGLVLRPDPATRVHGPVLRGHAGGYRAAWHHHAHVDAYRLYRHDETDLAIEAQHAHPSSDARLARVLTERRWAGACRLVDRLGPATGSSSVA